MLRSGKETPVTPLKDGMTTTAEGIGQKEANGQKRGRDTPLVSPPVQPKSKGQLTSYYQRLSSTSTSPREGEAKKKTRTTKPVTTAAPSTELDSIQEVTEASNKAIAKTDDKENPAPVEDLTSEKVSSPKVTNEPNGEPDPITKDTSEKQQDELDQEAEEVEEPNEETGNKEKPKRKRIRKRKCKKKQTFIVQASSDGKAELAGAPATKEDNSVDEDKPEIKDEEYWNKHAKEHERDYTFRCTFSMKIKAPEGEFVTAEHVLKTFNAIAREMQYIDPTTVFNTWNQVPPMIAAPIRASDIQEDTDMTRYVKKMYLKSISKTAKMELHIGSVHNPEQWQDWLNEYLQGGHHGKIYRNDLDTTEPQNVGHAIMSTAWSNTKAMSRRLSHDAGFPIACSIGDIVLKSEMGHYWSNGAREDGVKAIHFKTARENKEEAIEYLSNRMTGEYTSDQLTLCPLMKFQLRPGEVVARNEEEYQARLRRKQACFKDNIERYEKTNDIIGSIDDKVEGSDYTIRQLILRLKNQDLATKAAYPYLFYDVDKVGFNIRFIYFKFLSKHAIQSAKHILALLLRYYKSSYKIAEHFTIRARSKAKRNTWSLTGNRPTGRVEEDDDIPAILLIMCQGDESSDDDDLSLDDGSTASPVVPKGMRRTTPIPNSILRSKDITQGTHIQGSASLKSNWKEGDEVQEAEAGTTNLGSDDDQDGHETVVPNQQGDENSLGASTIKTHGTQAPEKRVLFPEHLTDNEAQEQDAETVFPEDDNDRTDENPEEGIPKDVPDDSSMQNSINTNFTREIVQEDEHLEDVQ